MDPSQAMHAVLNASQKVPTNEVFYDRLKHFNQRLEELANKLEAKLDPILLASPPAEPLKQRSVPENISTMFEHYFAAINTCEATIIGLHTIIDRIDL